MIYLGGDNWPREYRDVDLHEQHPRRPHQHRPARSGRAPATPPSHGPDFLQANDSWSQMINFRYGPDGSVTGSTGTTRTSATARTPTSTRRRSAASSRSATRRQLGPGRSGRSCPRSGSWSCSCTATTGTCGTRAASCRSAGADPEVHARLKRMLRDNPDVTRKLRALWALHVTGGLTRAGPARSCSATTASTSAAGRSNCSPKGKQPSDDALRQFATMARQDPSRAGAAVPGERAPARSGGEALGRRGGPRWRMPRMRRISNLPLMVWYAAEPVVELDMARALALAARIEAAAAVLVHGAAHRCHRHAGRASRADRPAGTHRGSGAAERSARRDQSDRKKEMTPAIRVGPFGSWPLWELGVS